MTGRGRNQPIRSRSHVSSSNDQQKVEISEFLDDLRELGIGDPKSPTADGPGSRPATDSPDMAALTDAQQRLVAEWVPLELSFGVPLFNMTANRAVCDKVSPVISLPPSPPCHLPVPSPSPVSPLPLSPPRHLPLPFFPPLPITCLSPSFPSPVSPLPPSPPRHLPLPFLPPLPITSLSLSSDLGARPLQ